MDDAEANYVIDAVHFLAREGHCFLSQYEFDIATGTWKHKTASSTLPVFSLEQALGSDDAEPATLSLPLRRQLYAHYLAEAGRIAAELRRAPELPSTTLDGDLGELQFFTLPAEDRRRH